MKTSTHRATRSPATQEIGIGEDRAVLQDDHPATNPPAESLDPKSVRPHLLLNDRAIGAEQVAAGDFSGFVRLPQPGTDDGHILSPLPVSKKTLRPRDVSRVADLQ